MSGESEFIADSLLTTLDSPLLVNILASLPAYVQIQF